MQEIALVVAGGMFGVVLGRFLDATPNWVFYVVLAAIMLFSVLAFNGTL